MTFHIFVGPKQTISHYHETLGEALQGTELEFSGLEIEFKGKPCIFAHRVRLLSKYDDSEHICTKQHI